MIDLHREPPQRELPDDLRPNALLTPAFAEAAAALLHEVTVLRQVTQALEGRAAEVLAAVQAARAEASRQEKGGV